MEKLLSNKLDFTASFFEATIEVKIEVNEKLWGHLTNGVKMGERDRNLLVSSILMMNVLIDNPKCTTLLPVVCCFIQLVC